MALLSVTLRFLSCVFGVALIRAADIAAGGMDRMRWVMNVGMLGDRYQGNLFSSRNSLAGEQIAWEARHLCQGLFLRQDRHLWLRVCPGWPLMLPSNPGMFPVPLSLEEEEVARDTVLTFRSRRWPVTGLIPEAERKKGKGHSR